MLVGDTELRLERVIEERLFVDPRVQIAILVAMNLMATTLALAALGIAGAILEEAVLAFGWRWARALKWLVGYAAVWVGAPCRRIRSLCQMSIRKNFE
jgi:hypothetical protein